MPTSDPLAASLEFRFTLDRAFAAYKAGQRDVAGAFARAAEAILQSAIPGIASDIANAASRKGRGTETGGRLIRRLTPSLAACAAVVLLLRGARMPVVNALSLEFGEHPDFDVTVRLLCGRVFESVALTSAISTPILTAMPALPSIEVAAPTLR